MIGIKNHLQKNTLKSYSGLSKNQVIWGANHFISNIAIDSSCWIFWDKGTGDNDFADGELAWTSFKTTVRKFFKSWVGANAKERDEKTEYTQPKSLLPCTNGF